jgi:phosphomevalonate kinase
VAPEGSGADVAASVIGGLVDYRMGEPPKKLVWPDRVRLSAVWTGAEARTSDLVAKVSQLRERDRETHDAALARIADASRALSAAMADNDAPRSIEAMRIHHDAMAALGRDAGAPIVEERLRAVAEAARAAGGAAKPAGAGGGDVAIALFSSVDDQKRFEDACSARGLTLLSLVLASEGVRRERAAER